jgi:hypothetical protein
MAAMFKEPSGSEPRKEMKRPVNNMRISFDMPILKGVENIAFC